MDYKIQKYMECPIHYENGQAFIAYIQANRHLLKGRPQVFQHGDYHIGNMMIDRDGALQIIDFDRYDFGDPWEEFSRIVWCAQCSPLFASGMVDGYFEGAVPPEFWRLLALYIASNALSSVYWAIPFGQDEVNTMLNQAKDILRWYDGMRKVVPAWYVRKKDGRRINMEIISIDSRTWRIEDGGVRFFLLAGDKRAVLVDCGMTVRNARDIAEGLVHVPVSLLITHADPDHIGSVGQFEEFYMHPAEATNFYKSQNRSGRFVPVWEGDVLDLGGRELEIVHLPGHTPGSITVLDRASRALFGGDPVQDGSIFMFGPQRELHAYVVSMEKLERLRDRFDLIYPSHATCPVTPDIIPRLKTAAQAILDGELTGPTVELHDSSIRRIDAGVATFLCDK